MAAVSLRPGATDNRGGAVKTLVGRVIAISRTPPWLPSWGCQGRRLSARTPVALRTKSVLALFRGGQQFVELCAPPQFRKQCIGLKGRVGAVIAFNGTFQQSQGSIVPTAVGQQTSEVIPRLPIRLRQRGGFSLLRDSVQYRSR